MATKIKELWSQLLVMPYMKMGLHVVECTKLGAQALQTQEYPSHAGVKSLLRLLIAAHLLDANRQLISLKRLSTLLLTPLLEKLTLITPSKPNTFFSLFSMNNIHFPRFFTINSSLFDEVCARIYFFSLIFSLLWFPGFDSPSRELAVSKARPLVIIIIRK